jgi:hypothetical protein
LVAAIRTGIRLKQLAETANVMFDLGVMNPSSRPRLADLMPKGQRVLPLSGPNITGKSNICQVFFAEWALLIPQCFIDETPPDYAIYCVHSTR